jgi:hypothetical protein
MDATTTIAIGLVMYGMLGLSNSLIQSMRQERARVYRTSKQSHIFNK